METDFLIIRDTREQKGHGYYFDNMVTETLDVGDYCIKGYENIIFLDRKASILEWAKNITEARFERELERAMNHRYKYLLFEFYAEELTNFPHGVSIPYNLRGKLKMSGAFLLKRTFELCVKFGVAPIFAGTAGKQFTKSLFKRIYEKETT